MTDKQTEQLVKLIYSGKNTYSDIRANLPNITDEDLRYSVSGKQCPLYNYENPCSPKNDTFGPFNLPTMDIEHLDIALPIENEVEALKFVNPPERFWKGYKFQDSEKFILSESGKNLLYKIHKEEKHFILTIIGIAIGIVAAIASIIALVQP